MIIITLFNLCHFIPLIYFPLIEYFAKIDSDLKMGSEEESLLNAVKKRRQFGKKHRYFYLILITRSCLKLLYMI